MENTVIMLGSDKLNLRGTHTENNLRKAVQYEALSYIKYKIYADLLKESSKDLDEKINCIINDEKEYFKIWAEFLVGEDFYDNEGNLLDAIEIENLRGRQTYPEFARVAREEGFYEISEKFDKFSDVKSDHAHLFASFFNVLTNNDD